MAFRALREEPERPEVTVPVHNSQRRNLKAESRARFRGMRGAEGPASLRAQWQVSGNLRVALATLPKYAAAASARAVCAGIQRQEQHPAWHPAWCDCAVCGGIQRHEYVHPARSNPQVEHVTAGLGSTATLQLSRQTRKSHAKVSTDYHRDDKQFNPVIKQQRLKVDGTTKSSPHLDDRLDRLSQ